MGDMMVFREYRNDDLSRLLDIYNESFNCDYNCCLEDTSGKIFVLEVDNYIVAMATLDIIVDIFKKIRYGYVNNVCVDKNYRGLGYGRFIMLKLEEVAKNNFLSYIMLTSNNDRVIAQKLYKEIGYEVIDTCLFKKVI